MCLGNILEKKAKENLVKAIRTLQTFFPHMLEFKVFAQRFLRKIRGVPFERDFDAIAMFPDTPELLCLDIGGNRGFAIESILMNSKKLPIYSFEPNVHLAMKTSSRFKNNSRVKIFDIGLGDEEGEFDLFIPFYRGFMFDGLASFEPGNAEAWLRKYLYCYNHKHLVVCKRKSRIRRLDNLDLNPFFIKLDVQGYELKALKGGVRTIERAHPVLLIEGVRKGDDITVFLKDFGYDLFRYSDRDKAFIHNEAGSLNSFLMTEEKYEILAG